MTGIIYEIKSLLGTIFIGWAFNIFPEDNKIKTSLGKWVLQTWGNLK